MKTFLALCFVLFFASHSLFAAPDDKQMPSELNVELARLGRKSEPALLFFYTSGSCQKCELSTNELIEYAHSKRYELFMAEVIVEGRKLEAAQIIKKRSLTNALPDDGTYLQQCGIEQTGPVWVLYATDDSFIASGSTLKAEGIKGLMQILADFMSKPSEIKLLRQTKIQENEDFVLVKPRFGYIKNDRLPVVSRNNVFIIDATTGLFSSSFTINTEMFQDLLRSGEKLELASENPSSLFPLETQLHGIYITEDDSLLVTGAFPVSSRKFDSTGTPYKNLLHRPVYIKCCLEGRGLQKKLFYSIYTKNNIAYWGVPLLETDYIDSTLFLNMPLFKKYKGIDRDSLRVINSISFRTGRIDSYCPADDIYIEEKLGESYLHGTVVKSNGKLLAVQYLGNKLWNLSDSTWVSLNYGLYSDPLVTPPYWLHRGSAEDIKPYSTTTGLVAIGNDRVGVFCTHIDSIKTRKYILKIYNVNPFSYVEDYYFESQKDEFLSLIRFDDRTDRFAVMRKTKKTYTLEIYSIQ